jgi:hypothetical protein
MQLTASKSDGDEDGARTVDVAAPCVETRTKRVESMTKSNEEVVRDLED